MSSHRTLATTKRVLRQLRHEPPTVIQIVVGPCLLLTLFRFILQHHQTTFAHIGGPLLTIFPLVTIYQAASVTMLRERISGTLERLMTTPLRPSELVFGYAAAFALAAVLQALVASGLVLGLLDLDLPGSTWLVVLVAVSVGLLGTALGLLMSAILRSEIQATQSMVLIIIPQILLCGLIEPRETLPAVLHGASDLLPLSYAVDAMHHLTRQSSTGASTIADFLIVLAFAAGALTLASIVLRRRA